MTLTPDEIHRLLAARLQAVLGLDELPSAQASFDADLHADSLDLVEVVEGIEADLAGRGVRIRLPEDRLLGLNTVADAVESILRTMREQPA